MPNWPSDQVMPDLTGISLAEKIWKVRHDLPIILVPGYRETVSPAEAGIAAFVMKPVTKREIAKTIRKVLDRER